MFWSLEKEMLLYESYLLINGSTGSFACMASIQDEVGPGTAARIPQSSLARLQRELNAAGKPRQTCSAGVLLTVPKVQADLLEQRLFFAGGRGRPATATRAECLPHGEQHAGVSSRHGGTQSPSPAPSLSRSRRSPSRRPPNGLGSLLPANRLGGAFCTGELPPAPPQTDFPEEYEIFDLTTNRRSIEIAEPANPSRVTYRVYPPTQPSNRLEVHSLAAALEDMLQSAGTSTTQALEAWDRTFAELVRQVGSLITSDSLIASTQSALC